MAKPLVLDCRGNDGGLCRTRWLRPRRGSDLLIAAKTNEERRRVLRAIGPVWDGNEVWLLAAGGTFYFAFPQLYASSFSGFYLPLTMVLWLLILRAIGIEFRAHIEIPCGKSSSM